MRDRIEGFLLWWNFIRAVLTIALAAGLVLWGGGALMGWWNLLFWR